MITLDSYCETRGIKPDFLKIDVQGYELEVLKGAQESLRNIEVILTEVNYLEVYQGAPLAAELIGWLSKREFVLYDVVNFMRRPLDKALWQSDMIFVRLSSPLLVNKRYS
jgi:hypothetical protein